MLPPDTNLVVLVGTLVTPPEPARHGGALRLDLTIATRSTGPPRRVDAIPVTWWDPPPELGALGVGDRVSVVAGLRRRFWATAEGRRSRLDVVASAVEPAPGG